jgi:UDP-2,3-diacylglucosamine pyrophosphatase LpxH
LEPTFTKAKHTFVVSDIHLSDAEPPHPRNPLWKKFKRPEFFIDESFKEFLKFIQKNSDGPSELVLNGDIFDFDSVMTLPVGPGFKLNWLERRRGLNSEERKSRFKIKTILEDHPVWANALRDFLNDGNRVIFVIGNHDIELHWPSVQLDIAQRLGVGELTDSSNLRFAEWYYISNQDTLIEHGNQYDSYCLCYNPINPLVQIAGAAQVRVPFGNLAGKFILNGMGLMNPHSEVSYIKNSLSEYFVFYYQKMLFEKVPLKMRYVPKLPQKA